MSEIFTKFLLFSLVAFNSGYIKCQSGKLLVTLDQSNKQLNYSDGWTGQKTSGTAVYTIVDGRQYYHLPFSFQSGVQLFNDGREWWMCLTSADCFRCQNPL